MPGIEWGEGLPVVLLQGIPTSPELWRKLIPRVQGVCALAWEMVRYGQPILKGPGKAILVARQADDLSAWMRQLAIEKAVMAGRDLGGGGVAQKLLGYPELCSGLLLTNAIGYGSWPVPSVRAMQAGTARARGVGHAPTRQAYRGRKDRSPRGGQILTPEGADSIQKLVMAQKAGGMTAQALGETIFPYRGAESRRSGFRQGCSKALPLRRVS